MMGSTGGSSTEVGPRRRARGLLEEGGQRGAPRLGARAPPVERVLALARVPSERGHRGVGERVGPRAERLQRGGGERDQGRAGP